MPDDQEWAAGFYCDASGILPAYEFLTSATPASVRRQLLVIVLAVLQMGPPRFPTSGQMWRIMSRPRSKKEVDLSGVCEARDKHANTLYRLFCLLDRDAPEHGFEAPVVVLLGGMRKPVRTAAPQSAYRAIDALRFDYLATRRLATGDHAGLWWPKFDLGEREGA